MQAPGQTYLATFACVCAWHSSWYLAICSGIALPIASLSFWRGSFRRPPCEERDKIQARFTHRSYVQDAQQGDHKEAVGQQMQH